MRLKLVLCFYLTVNAPCFANTDYISQLKHVRQSLESSKRETALERAYEILKYGVVPLIVNIVFAVVGVVKVARMAKKDPGWSPLPYLMVPHPLGFWSDYITGARQARDLGERHEDAVFRLKHGVFVLGPFLPIVSIYRILSRESELEDRVRFLESLI